MALDRYLQDPYEPVETTKADRAFPARFERLMPAPEEIPPGYWRRSHPWHGLTMRFMGIGQGWSSTSQFKANDGIDAETAFWHLYTLCGSYGPKHEFKEAAVAFLGERWFHGVADGGVVLFGQDWPGREKAAANV